MKKILFSLTLLLIVVNYANAEKLKFVTSENVKFRVKIHGHGYKADEISNIIKQELNSIDDVMVVDSAYDVEIEIVSRDINSQEIAFSILITEPFYRTSIITKDQNEFIELFAKTAHMSPEDMFKIKMGHFLKTCNINQLNDTCKYLAEEINMILFEGRRKISEMSEKVFPK